MESFETLTEPQKNIWAIVLLAAFAPWLLIFLGLPMVALFAILFG